MRVIWKFMGLALLTASSAFADVSYTGGTYSQDFDSLSSSGASNVWANDTTINGWYLFRRNTTADPTPVAVNNYDAGTGSSNTGKFYSFGAAASSSDRALGGVASSNAGNWGGASTGAVAGWISVGIQNSTGLTIDSFSIRFDGEQWRDGGVTSPGSPTAQAMQLEYGFGSSFTSVSSWVPPGGNFDWTSPVFVNTSSGAAVNGNAAGLVAGRGGTITGLNWINGDKLFIRWVERNDVNNDHGLAIDNFQFSATAVPEPTAAGLLALTGIAGMAFRRRRS